MFSYLDRKNGKKHESTGMLLTIEDPTILWQALVTPLDCIVTQQCCRALHYKQIVGDILFKMHRLAYICYHNITPLRRKALIK